MKQSVYSVFLVLFLSLNSAKADSLKGSERELPSKVIAAVVDGMSLTLGNHIQQVQVRAKSLGPGFCAVTFELAEQSTDIAAPPLTWSSWTNVGPGFTGVTTQRLGFSIGCDTGAVAQVMYSK